MNLGEKLTKYRKTTYVIKLIAKAITKDTYKHSNGRDIWGKVWARVAKLLLRFRKLLVFSN